MVMRISAMALFSFLDSSPTRFIVSLFILMYIEDEYGTTIRKNIMTVTHVCFTGAHNGHQFHLLKV